jgi:hypothetical protein
MQSLSMGLSFKEKWGLLTDQDHDDEDEDIFKSLK